MFIYSLAVRQLLKVDLVYQSHMGYNADYFNTIWLLKNILQIKNIYVKFILESVP